MLWTVFAVVVVVVLFVDLFVLHRKAHAVRLREALLWSGLWIALAFGFMGLVLATRGTRSAVEFLTCYLIEESLSVDNLFVFLAVFAYFKTPEQFHHKVLFWGIMGAVFMRGLFIVLGVAFIQKFDWLVLVLGGLLALTGVRLAIKQDQHVSPERNPVLRLFRRFFRVSESYAGARFFTRVDGRLFATPLFVVLLVIETTDVVFAVDSVPAALAISLDPFIVYTSNIFAILGLRSLYFALAGIMPLFVYLHYGLATILVFTGAKMVLGYFGHHMPVGVALGVVAGVLITSVLASIVVRRLRPGEAG